MKKRLRKKLSRGEYRNPMTYTKRERAANHAFAQFLQRAFDDPVVGPKLADSIQQLCGASKALEVIERRTVRINAAPAF